MKNCGTLDKMLKMTSGDREKAGKVVARSLYKILRRNGFSHSDIMHVGVIRDIKLNGKDQENAVGVQELIVAPDSKEVA
jgi:hypothetical protein